MIFTYARMASSTVSPAARSGAAKAAPDALGKEPQLAPQLAQLPSFATSCVGGAAAAPGQGTSQHSAAVHGSAAHLKPSMKLVLNVLYPSTAPH